VVIDDWEVWGDPKEIERRKAERARAAIPPEQRREQVTDIGHVSWSSSLGSDQNCNSELPMPGLKLLPSGHNLQSCASVSSNDSLADAKLASKYPQMICMRKVPCCGHHEHR
jgi:hypothetical protein